MLILRDFKCLNCDEVFEGLVSSGELTTDCVQCGKVANNIIRKMTVHGADSFNGHYDEQLGQWFESSEHKSKTLQKLGKNQDSGQDSPRKSNKSSIIMTREQARKFDPGLDKRAPRMEP